MKKTLVTQTIFLSCIAFPFASQAVPFVNGDFSAALTGWNSSGDVTTASDGNGGQLAVLSGGAGVNPFSATLIQGATPDLFTFTPVSLAVDDLYLVFTLQEQDIGVDATETGGGLDDYLNLALYHATDLALDLLLGDVTELAVNALCSAGPAAGQVVCDVASLAGEDVAISFDLVDENDGRNIAYVLDDIHFSAVRPTALPISGSLTLLTAGLLLMQVRRRSR